MIIREPRDDDWQAILKVADASLPWQLAGNRQWLENRKRFDARLQRRHYVAETDGDRQIVGYASLEAGAEQGRFRIFIVTDAKNLNSVGELLYQNLRADLTSVGAHVLWAREETRDEPLLSFFQQHGFGKVQEFRTEQGLDVVVLEQPVNVVSAAHPL